MPRDESIRRVLILGSGPIVIGQACEFDYSGTQACRALKREGIEVVLLNSNPATIMTDPQFADRTYIEPITPEIVDLILRREAARGTPVDSILPTLGGQTGLNCAMAAAEAGILEIHNVRLIGANRETIRRAEDRELFKRIVRAAGVDVPRSRTVHSLAEACDALQEIGLPVVLRPAFTLGGTGGGRARNVEEFERIAADALRQSPISQVLIEEDLTGWKEFELEMMRDRNDNVVVVCSIENLDPMGVHTGDSITVAPALTLTDREYQQMRDAAIRIMRAIGVETGGANIQFAVCPQTGRMVAIEMNPRVSRSSALASKATGFPIAKIATLLAIGYTLDELPNEITGRTVACFEPSIDYVVVKMPRFAFEKFPEADETLTTSMKSVGEAMAIGRSFAEALQKCIRSMEIKRFGYGLDANDVWLRSLRAGAGDSRPRWSGDAVEDSRPRLSRKPVVASHGQSRATGPHRKPGAAGPERSRVPTFPRSHEQPSQTDDPCGAPGPDEPPDRTDRPRALAGVALAEPPPDWREESTDDWPVPDNVLTAKIGTPCQGRIYYIRYALKQGWSIERISRLSGIDPWFVDQFAQLVEFEQKLLAVRPVAGQKLEITPRLVELYREARRLGYCHVQLRNIWNADAATLRELARRCDRPGIRLVDTCAAEFEARTPYYYTACDTPFARIQPADAPPPAGLQVGEPQRLDGLLRYEVCDDELRQTDRPKVVILGGGPNRIGQGIEFDYCCVHAALAAREVGYEAVMINSNPETVSTDYDVSDLLFFEPLTHEHVRYVCERLNGRPFDQPGGHVRGLIVQFGGQTPLNLAQGLKDAGLPILGTSPESIHLAEDRERFAHVLHELGLRQPDSGIARSREEAFEVAEQIGYPVLVRPSYVLGGRGMQLCNNRDDLERYISEALHATDREHEIDEQHPILVDKFLLDAIEVDVDAISDYGYPGRDESEACCEICGVMEHIEEAGVHSGDSCCVLPPHSLGEEVVAEIRRQVRMLARRLKVCGLLNVQFAVQFSHVDGDQPPPAGERSVGPPCPTPRRAEPPDATGQGGGAQSPLTARSDNAGAWARTNAVAGRPVIYVLEVNPRASRTVPFVGKATGVPWARLATQVMLGRPLRELLAEVGYSSERPLGHVAVKAPVFPFRKLGRVDAILGPEMRSTGEVMGLDTEYPLAFAKALLAAGIRLPIEGRALVSVNDPDKPRVVPIARALHEMGFELYSTRKTRQTLLAAGIPARPVFKHNEEGAPFLVDMIRNRQLDLLINTPIHTGSATHEGRWRVLSIELGIPLITTIAGANAAVGAIRALRERRLDVRALQDYMQ